jgi:hypothetical protein
MREIDAQSKFPMLGSRPRTFPPVREPFSVMAVVMGWKTMEYWMPGMSRRGVKIVSVAFRMEAKRVALLPKVAVPKSRLGGFSQERPLFFFFFSFPPSMLARYLDVSRGSRRDTKKIERRRRRRMNPTHRIPFCPPAANSVAKSPTFVILIVFTTCGPTPANPFSTLGYSVGFPYTNEFNTRLAPCEYEYR